MIEGPIPTGDPDEPYYPGVFECGAPTRFTDSEGSYACDAGHVHTPAWVREREGWDFAADLGEAKLLAQAGVRGHEFGVERHPWF